MTETIDMARAYDSVTRRVYIFRDNRGKYLFSCKDETLARAEKSAKKALPRHDVDSLALEIRQLIEPKKDDPRYE